MNDIAGKIRAAAPILGIILAFYWLFTYSGPYRYLAELQLARFGSYSPKITLLAICLVFYLLGELARMVLRGAERPIPVISATAAKVPLPARTSSPNLLACRPMIVSLVILAMGAYFFLNGISAGSLRELQMTDFANDNLPSRTLYAEVRGYADSSYLAENRYLYVPLREVPNSTAPIQLLVGVDENGVNKELSRQEDGSVRVRGMLERRLGNETRCAFEKNGARLAPACWVLRTNRTPAYDMRVGAMLILLSVVLGIWFSQRSKRRTAA